MALAVHQRDTAEADDERERTATSADLHRPRPYRDWIEDYGDVLWWRIPIYEPPHVGMPLDTAWPWENGDTRTLWWTVLPDAKRIQDQVPL